MRRGIVALLASLPVLLVVSGYAWMRDEPLSADAQTWLEQAQVDAGQSRAYVFLNGLDADPGQSPEALGAERLQPIAPGAAATARWMRVLRSRWSRRWL